MERSNGLKEAETIDAHKTLTCEGVDYNYRFDGAHFEIKPPVEIGEGSCRSLLSHGYIQMTDFNLCFNRDIEAKGNFSTPRTELAFCMGHGIEWGTSLKSDYFVIDTGEIALFHGGVRSENCTYLSGAGYRFISIDMSPAQFERMTSGLTEDTRLRIGAGAGLFLEKITSHHPSASFYRRLRIVPIAMACVNFIWRAKCWSLWRSISMNLYMKQTGFHARSSCPERIWRACGSLRRFYSVIICTRRRLQAFLALYASMSSS